jgi:hypothetical protein
MKRETAAARRTNNRRHSSFLTHGADDYDHRGLNRARREEGKAIIRDWQEPDPTNDAETVSRDEPTTFRIVVHTQVFENYGAHCWDGKGQCPQYWKAKGGNEYQRTIGTTNAVIAMGAKGVKAIADAIAKQVARNDDYYEEYAIGWDLIPNTEETYEEQMLREMYEEGYLAPGARTEAERTAYYHERLASLELAPA